MYQVIAALARQITTREVPDVIAAPLLQMLPEVRNKALNCLPTCRISRFQLHFRFMCSPLYSAQGCDLAHWRSMPSLVKIFLIT